MDSIKKTSNVPPSNKPKPGREPANKPANKPDKPKPGNSPTKQKREPSKWGKRHDRLQSRMEKLDERSQDVDNVSDKKSERLQARRTKLAKKTKKIRDKQRDTPAKQKRALNKKQGKYQVSTNVGEPGWSPEQGGNIKFKNVRSGRVTGYTTDPSGEITKTTSRGRTKNISEKKYKRQISRKLNKQV